METCCAASAHGLSLIRRLLADVLTLATFALSSRAGGSVDCLDDSECRCELILSR